MRDFLEGLGVMILFISVILGIMFFVAGMFQLTFWLDSKFDESKGVVYCDFEKVYEGKLYRVDKTLETENLQAPMFTVVVRNEGNYFKIEKTLFCKDLQISEQ